MTQRPSRQQILQRIIEIALGEFVKHGYHGTSIRDLCKIAGIGVGSINYYFQNKEDLYLAVIEEARRRERDDSIYHVDEDLAVAAPEEALRTLIRRLVGRLFSESPSSYLHKLVSWELVQPTFAMQNFVDNDIKPQHRALGRIVRTQVGLGIDQVQRRRRRADVDLELPPILGLGGVLVAGDHRPAPQVDARPRQQQTR